MRRTRLAWITVAAMSIMFVISGCSRTEQAKPHPSSSVLVIKKNGQWRFKSGAEAGHGGTP